MSQQVETEVGSAKGNRALESALSGLWEKARRASEVIIGLREDNRTLQKRVAELETELTRVKESLGGKAEEIKKLREDFSVLQASNNDTYSKEEKEDLKNKIQELIRKINSHL